MDILEITKLCIPTRIGVYEWEQRIYQTLYIDISLTLDLKTCDDDIAKTIDYEKLSREIKTLLDAQSFRLIETVANQIGEFIKTNYPASQIKVSVSKPHAIANADNVKVTIHY